MSEVLLPQQRLNEDINTITSILAIKRIPYINYGHETAGSFLSDFLYAVRYQEFLAEMGQGDPDSFQTQILSIKGPPGSGKTKFTRAVRKWLEIEGIPHSVIKETNWEQSGEERARSAGKIITPSDQLFADAEVEAAESYLERSDVEALTEDPKPLVLLRETPGGIASMQQNKWKVYRSLGATTDRNIALGEHPFNKRDYIDWHIAVNGNALINRYLVGGRYNVRYAVSLEEAQIQARAYGFIDQNHVLTDEEWALMKNGASPKQIDAIEKIQDDVLEELKNEPIIRNVQQLSLDIPSTDEVEQLLITADDKYKYIRPWEMGAYWQYLLQGVYNVPGDRALVGFNDPTPAQLGIVNFQSIVNLLR